MRKQGMTLEEFLELCYDCGLNPLPMIREKGINIKYYKDTSYCDVSVHHENINGRERVVLTYPDFETDWNEWNRFHDRYCDLEYLAGDLRSKRNLELGLNRPHRTVNKTVAA